MVISRCSRRCVRKLKNYSDKKRHSSIRLGSMLRGRGTDDIDLNSTFSESLVSNPNNASMNVRSNRSIVDRLLKHKIHEQMTKEQNEKNVCSIENDFIRCTSIDILFRNSTNTIRKIATRVYIGNTKRKNFMEKHKKRTKLRRNWTVYRISMTDFRFNSNRIFDCS